MASTTSILSDIKYLEYTAITNGSGSICGIKDKISLIINGEFRLDIKFIQDSSAAVNIKFNDHQEKSVTLELTNFNNSIGQGTTDPVVFATDSITKNILAISFTVFRLGVSYTLNYTLWEKLG